MADVAAPTRVRFSLWITQADKRRLWRAYKRNTPVTVEFLYNTEGERDALLQDVYQVCLRLETGSRRRLGQPVKGYMTYKYEGVTAYGAPFELVLTHDDFDPREYLFVTPPENPIDWARTFTPRPTSASQSW